MKGKEVTLAAGTVRFSNDRPAVLIAGPCIIEDERSTLALARDLKAIADDLGIGLVFKASYDKANRSSVLSYRGPGLKKGLRILARVKERHRLPVLTDVHCRADVREASRVADILQVPAFLCRQTDLLCACADTGLPVNVKKGQFLAPDDVTNIIEKIESRHNRNVLLTERGTSFGYHNLVVDMRSIALMKRTGYPVIFDATHSVQLPGGRGTSTGGQREYALPLAKSALAQGIAGVFVEVHPDPRRALSDGPNSLKVGDVPAFMRPLIRIDRLVKSVDAGD